MSFPVPGSNTPDPPLTVIFAVMQTGVRSNGGVESITQVIERLGSARRIVVTQVDTEANRRWCDAGAEVHVWPIPYRMGSPFWNGRWPARARRVASWWETNCRMAALVRRSGSRVVHCNDELALWHSAFGARAAGAAVVQNIRDIKAPNCPYGFRWKVASRVSSHTLVLSREMSDSYRRRVISGGRHGNSRARSPVFIYSAVDTSVLRPPTVEQRQDARRALGIGPRQFAIGCVGAFVPKKAQYELLADAVPLLRKRLPESHIYFLGDFNPATNGFARRCKGLVDEHGLGDFVSFVGHARDMARWYWALDLVVHASRHEGLARSMIESISAGTPVVSFDVCSAHEILTQHHCGIVVKQADYKSLVGRIAALAAQSDTRARLGENGARVARRLFEPSRIISQYEQLYHSLQRSRVRHVRGTN